MEITLRTEAVKKGLRKYYTGRPCAKGHDCARYTQSGACVRCAAGYASKYTTALNKQLAARSLGLRRLEFFVHPDDVPRITRCVTACELARGWI